MKSKDFVLQHFPNAYAYKGLPVIPIEPPSYYVITNNNITIGIGFTESSAWVDAKNFIKQHGSNPEKW